MCLYFSEGEISVNGQSFTIKPDMVTISRAEKKVHGRCYVQQASHLLMLTIVYKFIVFMPTQSGGI